MSESDLHSGDGFDFLDRQAENSCELAFLDPPFNLNKKYDGASDNLKDADYWDWTRNWLDKLVRVVRPGGSIFVHHIPRWLITIGGHLNTVADFRHWITWDATSGPMGKSLQPNHYGILYYVKRGGSSKYFPLRTPNRRCRNCGYLTKDFGGKKHTIPAFGPLLSDVWTDLFRVKHVSTRTWRHPCELPVPLLERIILMASEEGDLVIDPCFGSGTTAVACKRLGRNFTGCELSEEYHSVALARVAASRPSLLNARPVSYWPDGNPISIRDEDLAAVAGAFRWPEKKEHLDFFRPVLSCGKEKSTKKAKNTLTSQPSSTNLPLYSLTAGTRDSREKPGGGKERGNERDQGHETETDHHPGASHLQDHEADEG